MKYTFSLVLIICMLNVSAAAEPYTGLVLDAESGEPLPFTNIVISGQNRGTVANADGRFVLDRAGIVPDDTILFSHMGYETLKLPASKLAGSTRVLMHPASISLMALEIYDRQLTAEEILERVRKNYATNHPPLSHRQQLFFHKYERTPFPRENQVILKESDFVGLDKATFQELFAMLPEELVEYQDARVELYSADGRHKLKPLEGISLEESSTEELGKLVEKRLSTFFEDIEKSNNTEDVYYKFRTGILSMKADESLEGDSSWSTYQKDSLHYPIPAKYVKDQILFLYRHYADPESDNWEFVRKTGRYDYQVGEMTIFNDELVYTISFTPRSRGLFEGVMYISTATFAILQLDFAYAENKTDENFQLLGIGHSMTFKKGRVIFERGEKGYYVKYISASQHEKASITRDFSVMKKEKRFLWDKTLNEMKLSAQLYFDIDSQWELLVMDREAIDAARLDELEQPPVMKFRKEYAYSPEMWTDGTVIAPTTELEKYTRKE